MSWNLNITGGNNVVGLRWYADMNDWMDCCVYVPREYEGRATKVIKTAINEFWDQNDQCYGDMIEDGLIDADIPFMIEYCEYDDETDEVSPEWEEHFDYLRSRGIPIHRVDAYRIGGTK